MRVRSWKWAPLMGAAVVLALATVPSLMAECGLPGKAVKPSAWQPVYGGAHVMRAALGNDRDRDDGPSIVGMWHVIFTGQTMNKEPFSGVVDNAISVWNADGTEIMNSSRPAQDGNFCLGVWQRTGERKYFLNHIPWAGNDPTNAPSGIGNPQAGVQILEEVTLSADGNSYSGSFSLVGYKPDGSTYISFTGTIAAKRITVTTKFGDLL